MQEILITKNVFKSYSNHVALQDISINIPQQSIFGLLGPNGAGKTTLIRIINQIIAADKGEIIINGESLNPKHIREIGYLPEERGLYKKMKVGEQLLYLAQLRGLSKNDAVTKIKSWFKKLEVEGWWNKNIEDLSKGMQQKIQFIATVMHNPKIIILDEPFSGFDPVNANMIKDKILELRENGSTIIFSTHRMESVEELCDYISLINKSKNILTGPKKQIKDNFKTNTFVVEHKNAIAGTVNGYHVLSSDKLEENMFKSVIQMQQQESPNKLLSDLMKVVEIHSFFEKIPNMNDIFISKVQEREGNEQ